MCSTGRQMASNVIVWKYILKYAWWASYYTSCDKRHTIRCVCNLMGRIISLSKTNIKQRFNINQTIIPVIYFGLVPPPCWFLSWDVFYVNFWCHISSVELSLRQQRKPIHKYVSLALIYIVGDLWSYISIKPFFYY